MTERTSYPADLDPRIEVEARRDGSILVLEGKIKGIYTFLAITAQTTSDFTQFNRVNGHYSVLRRNYCKKDLLVSHSENFELYSVPRPSQSAALGSETQYVGQTENKEVAIQVLDRDKKSKPSHHHDGSEFYHHVVGRLAVRKWHLSTGELKEEILSSQHPIIIVPEGYAHQVKSVGGLAISVLVCDFTKHVYHPNLDDLFDSN